MFKSIFTKILGPVSLFCVLYFFYLLFSVSAYPNLSLFFRGFDTYWLIGQGEWIWSHKQIPYTNVIGGEFTRLSEISWVCYQWLFTAFIGLLHRIQGLHGIIWGASSILAITLGLWGYVLYRRNFRGFPDIIVSLMMLSFFLTVFADIRPFIATILFGTVLQLLLTVSQDSGIRRAGLVLLFLIWANTHLGFVFGIFWLLAEMTAAAWKKKSLQPLLCWGLCFLATGVNPGGFSLYGYLFNLGNSPYMNSEIIELQPFGAGFDLTLQVGVLLGVLAFLFTLKSDKIRSAERVMWVAAMVMTFVSARHIAFLILFVPVFYAVAINRVLSSFAPEFAQRMDLFSLKNDKPHISLPIAIFVGMFLSMGKVFEVPKIPHYINPGFIRYLEANPLKQPVLTTGEIGSELIYFTNARSFLDTRYDMYGDRYVMEFARLLELKGDWQQGLENRKITYILYPKFYKNLSLLQKKLVQNKWKIIYSDNNLLLFSRDPS